MTEIEYRFRHKIGDELYDLHHPYDDDLAPEETWAYTIRRRTARFVYVHHHPDHFKCRDTDRLVRFSVDDLERDGRAWNRANQMGLNVRPLPHWPLMPAEVRTPATREVTGYVARP